MSTLRVAVVQHDIAWFDREANFGHLAPTVADAVATGAQLVLLTETFSTGFGFAEPGIAEPHDGPSAQFLHEQAVSHDIWIGGSCPEIAPDAPDDDQRPSNVFVLAGPDGTTHRYRKIHPFSHSGEDRHVRAGDQFLQVEINGVRLSCFVCYDLRFADEFWQLAETTDAYIVVANWPGERRQHWSSLLRARAIENQAYVIAANRVGSDIYGLDYTGDSTVIDPMGEILASAAQTETILHATIDTDHVAGTRDHFRFLQDRR